jgi:hypothetical protein
MGGATNPVLSLVIRSVIAAAAEWLVPAAALSAPEEAAIVMKLELD